MERVFVRVFFLLKWLEICIVIEFVFKKGKSFDYFFFIIWVNLVFIVFDFVFFVVWRFV